MLRLFSFPVPVKHRYSGILLFCEINQKHRKQANHSEKIVLNSSEMKREKIALFERQRVCDFSFMSDEFINFCRQMSGLRVFVFTCPCHVSMSCKLVFYFRLSLYNVYVLRHLTRIKKEVPSHPSLSTQNHIEFLFQLLC